MATPDTNPEPSLTDMVEFVIPDGLPLQYSNYTYVQATNQDVVVSFFQIQHRIIASAEPLRAHCLGRFVLAPDHARVVFETFKAVLKNQGILPAEA